jgi:hypothetical protein
MVIRAMAASVPRTIGDRKARDEAWDRSGWLRRRALFAGFDCREQTNTLLHAVA